MSEIRATTISDTTGTGPVTLTGQSAAKAWANFNGQGTVSIRESLNVSSLTDFYSGSYALNFTNAFQDTNYAALGTFSTLSSTWDNAFLSSMVIGGTYNGSAYPTYYSTTQLGVTNYANGNFTDIDQVNVAVFR